MKILYNNNTNWIDILKKIDINDLNIDKFSQFLKFKIIDKKLQDHIDLAKKYNINATPIIFINKRRIIGVPVFKNLSEVIGYELDVMSE